MPRTQRTGGKRGVHHDPQKIQQAVEAVKNGNTVREAHGKDCDRVCYLDIPVSGLITCPVRHCYQS